MVAVVGTCQTTDHATAGRAHLVVAAFACVEVAAALGIVLVAGAIARWHFNCKAFHDGAAGRR